MSIETISERKAALRADVRKRNRELNLDEVKRSNEDIFVQLTTMPEFEQAGTIFCFVGTSAEIDTKPILLNALKSGKKVAVPLCIAPGIMEARQITAMSDLTQTGSFGILEPSGDCPVVMPEEIDLAVVPCISCDRECMRLGQGGGFYDRFMQNASFSMIALCREKLILEKVPAEPWDLPVDCVVTESNIYRRK